MALGLVSRSLTSDEPKSECMNIVPAKVRSDPRSWLALAFFVTIYLVFDPIEAMIHRPLANALGLHMIQDGAMAPAPYGVLMIVRLGLDMLVVACLLAIARRRFAQFPLSGPTMTRNVMSGFAVGLVVMVGAITLILLSRGASVSLSRQRPMFGLLNSGAWLAFGFVGAAGEELAGRVAVLLVAQPLIGRRGAILASGLLFAGIHISNPGVTSVWLVRLFVQGMLLAYAVYRTGSFWWSVGYHTGWNWGGAPLFGAAGSGYLNKGHLLNFMPTGPDWITGGAVGPEGSVFAYVAMLAALLLLIMTTPPLGIRHNRSVKSGADAGHPLIG
jgi:membrane protease YdiL (CAAX protease family)